MLRISKMTDYATLILAELRAHDPSLTSATDIARRTGLGSATVSKVLKTLARASLVSAQRGSNGGYALAQSASTISAAAIIDAIEGPVAITECSSSEQSCDLEAICGLGEAWQLINHAIRDALQSITLDDLCAGRNIPQTFPLLPLSQLLGKSTEGATQSPSKAANS